MTQKQMTNKGSRDANHRIKGLDGDKARHESESNDYNLGFTYFIMGMDSEALKVFTRLINSEQQEDNSEAFRLASLYSN